MHALLHRPNSQDGGKRFQFLLPIVVLGMLASICSAQEVLPGPAVPPTALNLQSCLQIGLGNQPSLKAAQASLGAAQVQHQALNNLGLASAFSKELPFRKKQACLGITIASAEITKIEWDTAYAITRNYFSVQYARQQEELIKKLLVSLEDHRQTAEAAVKGGNPQFSQIDVDKLVVAAGIYKTRLIKAQYGSQRALAALREAMGLDCHYPLVILTEPMPPLGHELSKDHLIALAVARRGEMVQASAALDVVNLEVCAQGQIRSLQAHTFAAGSDIHAKPVPPGSFDENYRPWPIGLEMPTMMVGHKEDRVNRAREFSFRTQALVEKTKNLIVLEAENGYHQWKEAADKAETLKNLLVLTGDLVEKTQKRFTGLGKVTVDELLQAQGTDLQVQAEFNQALYEHVLALATLERITAGGFIPLYRQSFIVPHP